jgi:organic hydroperoxide reductase OsmC/OhrA
VCISLTRLLSGDPREPTARRTSPAHLFVGSLGASFALTLAQRLDAAALPWCSLDILTEASLVSTSGALRFDTIMVRATVAGADTVAGSTYRQVAKEARDRCPLARSIRGNVAYKLGEVLVVERGAGASTRHPIGPFRG